jgi:hypothetical protein
MVGVMGEEAVVGTAVFTTVGVVDGTGTVAVSRLMTAIDGEVTAAVGGRSSLGWVRWQADTNMMIAIIKPVLNIRICLLKNEDIHYFFGQRVPIVAKGCSETVKGCLEVV